MGYKKGKEKGGGGGRGRRRRTVLLKSVERVLQALFKPENQLWFPSKARSIYKVLSTIPGVDI